MIPLSICIPTYERYEMLLNSFDKVLKDDRVGEIIICDDASSIENYEDVYNAVKWIQKVKLFRNDRNLDCYANKRMAISKASNEFCILLDSDNIIDKSYIDKIYQEDWVVDTILTPEWAMPHFDFRQHSGITVTKYNVASMMKQGMFQTMLNAANYFVSRDRYLEIWDELANPVTSDSIFMAYRWLANGGKIKIVEGLRYSHTVHAGSHYQNNVKRTPIGFHEEVVNNIMELK